jgi:hypothetical protein
MPAKVVCDDVSMPSNGALQRLALTILAGKLPAQAQRPLACQRQDVSCMKLRREDGPEGAVELQAVISSSSGNEAARSAADARTAQRQPSVRHGLRALVSGSKLNVLLLAIPFAVVSRCASSGHGFDLASR